MKTFLFTQPIDFPNEEFRGHNRNTYPQQYLKNILEDRIEDTTVVICDHRQVISKLNSFVTNADKELKQYMDDYAYALELANSFGLINENTFESSCEREERIDKRQKHRNILCEKSPKYGIQLATECFTYSQPRDISTFTDVKINTGIAGIIVPIGHADYRDMWDIIHGINGFFAQQLECVKSKYDIKAQADSSNPSVIQRENAINRLFYQRFQIPVFESFKFAPGDRFNNLPIGKSFDWKENEYNFGREDYIKFAFNKWIDIYFPKKSN